MKKMLFIDRDGTIIKEPTDNFQVDRPEKLEFMPGVIGALREITGNTDFRLVMVSNQDGLGTADFPMEDFMFPQTLMLKVLESEGIVFDEICIDPSRPEEYSRFKVTPHSNQVLPPKSSNTSAFASSIGKAKPYLSIPFLLPRALAKHSPNTIAVSSTV